MTQRMSALLIAGALVGFNGFAAATMQSNPGVGMEGASQPMSQQGAELGADASMIGGPDILFGRIEKIENNGFVIQGDRGQFMKLQLSRNSSVVCSNGSQATLMTSRTGVEEQSETSVSHPEAANKDIGRGSGFLSGSSDCHFQPGDLIRIEASDAGTMTTITRLPYEEEENGSQIAAENAEPNTSTQ